MHSNIDKKATCHLVHTRASVIKPQQGKMVKRYFLSVTFPGHTAVVKLLWMLVTIITNNYIIINEA